MFKKLLVPLDGSSLSEQVLPLARELLEAGAGEAVLLAVGEAAKATRKRKDGLHRAVPLTAMAGASVRGVLPAAAPAYYETKGQAVDREVNELLDYLRDAGRPLIETERAVHAVVHLGDPGKEIVDYARKNEVDLIVMTTHGRSGLREAVQGSVTAHVIRSGVAPVLVLRPKGK